MSTPKQQQPHHFLNSLKTLDPCCSYMRSLLLGSLFNPQLMRAM